MRNELNRKTDALMGMAENFGKVMSDALLTMWLRLLEPYEAREVEFAVMRVIEQYEYKTFPPFAVLKSALDRAVGQIDSRRALEMQAESEWVKLLDNVTILGAYGGPPASIHPTTAYVLRSMGGWDAACRWEIAKLEWRHREFKEAWKLAHDSVGVMALGATAVAAISTGPQSARQLLSGIMNQKGLELEQ